jgi:hypothetical protein
MTLKQSVEDPHSALRAFFNTRLPNTKTVQAQWKRHERTGICIAPPVDKIATAGGAMRAYPYDEVGHAASLRLTLLFSPAVNQAALPPSRHPLTRSPWPAAQAFHAELSTALGHASGFDPLPADQERRLARGCHCSRCEPTRASMSCSRPSSSRRASRICSPSWRQRGWPWDR